MLREPWRGYGVRGLAAWAAVASGVRLWSWCRRAARGIGHVGDRSALPRRRSLLLRDLASVSRQQDERPLHDELIDKQQRGAPLLLIAHCNSATEHRRMRLLIVQPDSVAPTTGTLAHQFLAEVRARPTVTGPHTTIRKPPRR